MWNEKLFFCFVRSKKTIVFFYKRLILLKRTFWKLQWGDSIFFSHGTSHSAGVMILFNRFPGKIINHISDINGHWLMVIADINDENFFLMCVYGYSERGKNKTFISDLCKLLTDCMKTYSTDKIIVGGEFNLVPHLWLDRQPPRARCHKYDDLIVELINRTNLVDYWSKKPPNSIQFSWFNAPGNGQSSRIDYWLISSPLVNYVSKRDISASPLTDRCAITSSFLFSTPEPGLNHVWKFNNTLLDSESFCKDVRQLIVETDA